MTGTSTGGTNLNIEFNTGTISKVQLNYGTVALPFVLQSFDKEYSACRRYYEKSYSYSVAPATANAGGGLWFTSVLGISTANGSRWPLGKHPMFTVIKRSTPTVTVYTYGGTVGLWVIGGAELACSTSADMTGLAVYNNTGGSVTPIAGEAYGHWVADARM